VKVIPVGTWIFRVVLYENTVDALTSKIDLLFFSFSILADIQALTLKNGQQRQRQVHGGAYMKDYRYLYYGGRFGRYRYMVCTPRIFPSCENQLYAKQQGRMNHMIKKQIL
jgi:hypothetical protein